MTRKSRRELERALEALDRPADGVGGMEIVTLFRDERTGDVVDRDGEPVDPDDGDTDDVAMFIIHESVVMLREDAEAEGREILGPAAGPSIPPENDVVRVAPDGVLDRNGDGSEA